MSSSAFFSWSPALRVLAGAWAFVGA